MFSIHSITKNFVGGVKLKFNKVFASFYECFLVIPSVSESKKQMILKQVQYDSSNMCFAGLSNNKKFAFTLSEVLIALTIIGVIAAITIPTFMNAYLQEQTVTQTKKFYSDFCAAIKMSEITNGTYQDWDFSLNGVDFFNMYLYPYITIQKTKKNTVEKVDGIIYLNLLGEQEKTFTPLYGSAVIATLNSGVQIFTPNVTASQELYKTYLFDINGYKKPNKIGRDLFYLALHKELGPVPFYWNDGQAENVQNVKISREKLRNGPSSHNYQCNKKGRGMWCLALIMSDAWTIKKDYPW